MIRTPSTAMPSSGARSGGRKWSTYPNVIAAITSSITPTSIPISARKPNASTIGPPASGPTTAPSGDAPAKTANAKPMRLAGARSWSVVIISPLFPSEKPLIARPSTKTHTLPATMAIAPASACATKDRTITG